MNFHRIPPRQLSLRLRSIPLPTDLKSEFQTTFLSWSQHSGPKWAGERLKIFKNGVIKEFAGQDTGEDLYPWFAKTSNGSLKGIWRTLRNLSLHGKLREVLDLLNYHTAWTQIRLNALEVEEIHESITSFTIPINRGWPNFFKEFDNWLCRQKNVYRKVRCGGIIPLLQCPPSPKQCLRLKDDALSLWLNEAHPPETREYLEKALGAKVRNEWAFPPFGFLVGEIHLTPAPGCKSRYYAVPNLLVQRLLDPLKNSLAELVKSLPWDCSFDQKRADQDILAAIRAGRTVHSVDLSAATDHFPWEYQKHVLEKVMSKTRRKTGRFKGKNHYRSFDRFLIDFFASCIELGLWKSKIPGVENETRLRWTSGQPLGLSPSFFLFTLSHGLLLRFLQKSKWGRDFYVLGDDVVILNDALYSSYIAHLDAMSIPYSQLKSVSSNRYASFAGAHFTKLGRFYTPKWVEWDRRNLLDVIAYWNYPSLYKGWKDETLISKVLSLPEPYGIGRNPDGIPLANRLTTSLVVELLDKPDREVTHLSTVSWQSVRSLPDDHREKLQRSLELRPDWSCVLNDRQIVSTEIVELFYHSGLNGYPQGFIPRVDPWVIGKLSYWKRILQRAESCLAD